MLDGCVQLNGQRENGVGSLKNTQVLNRSNVTVMIDFLDGANDGLMSAICFLDVAKCFDTIGHDILLLKPEKYGIRGKELQLFKILPGK